MAEQLTLDQKIQGLADYYEKLGSMNPNNMGTGERPPTYSSATRVVEGIGMAQRSLKFDIGCYARIEYGKRGFDTTDLRAASAEEIKERAGILAIMSAPPIPEAFYETAGRIGDLLGHIVAGDEIAISRHTNGYGICFQDNTIHVDTNRPIYTIFNSHISGREMYVAYDHPGFDHEVAYNDYRKTEIAFGVSLMAMYEDIASYPVEV